MSWCALVACSLGDGDTVEPHVKASWWLVQRHTADTWWTWPACYHWFVVSPVLSLAQQKLMCSCILRSCLHHLLPPPHDLAVTSRLRKPTVYPRPSLQTKRYCSAVSFKYSIITLWSYLVFAIIGSVFFFAIFITFVVFCVCCVAWLVIKL